MTPGELAEHLNGLDEVRALVRDFTPEAVAGACGIEAEEIRRMARELAAAERGCVYARIGTCTQEFGTHASWLVDVLNVLTGNLDREGGAMFTRAAAGQKNSSWRRRRTRREVRPLEQPRARPARAVRGAARVGSGRGDRDARRGPGARADHGGRQPDSSPPRTATGSRARSRASTSCSRSTST